MTFAIRLIQFDCWNCSLFPLLIIQQTAASERICNSEIRENAKHKPEFRFSLFAASTLFSIIRPFFIRRLDVFSQLYPCCCLCFRLNLPFPRSLALSHYFVIYKHYEIISNATIIHVACLDAEIYATSNGMWCAAKKLPKGMNGKK